MICVATDQSPTTDICLYIQCELTLCQHADSLSIELNVSQMEGKNSCQVSCMWIEPSHYSYTVLDGLEFHGCMTKGR